MTKSASLSRRPWITSVVWGWRLELQLGTATAALQLLSLDLTPVGPLLVLAVQIVILVKRPDLRARFETITSRHHEVAKLHDACLLSGLVNSRGEIPQVIKHAPLTVGRRYLVRLPVGIAFEAVEQRAQTLASSLAAKSVRVTAVRENAQLFELAVIRKDAFPKVLAPSTNLNRGVNLWSPTEFGIAEDGRSIAIQLPEHNLLIGGEPGSGKSVALAHLLSLAACDPHVTITLLDGKQVELAEWAPIADLFVGPDQSQALDALAYLQGLMDTRYDLLMTERRRKITPSSGFGLHLVVIDELAFYLRGGKKEVRDAFAESLRDLVSRGRAAGIIVIAATQKPSHDVVPTWIRDLFAYRLAMRCTSNDASDTILGSGWAQRGFSATAIDPTNRGVGYLLADGTTPQLLKLPYLDDDQIRHVVQHAMALRGIHGR
jgi:S-DNA-T family DNA segregation ATPase FtsK/SpoIIIE